MQYGVEFQKCLNFSRCLFISLIFTCKTETILRKTLKTFTNFIWNHLLCVKRRNITIKLIPESLLELNSCSFSHFPHILFGLSLISSLPALFCLNQSLRLISLSSVKTGSNWKLYISCTRFFVIPKVSFTRATMYC